MNSYHEQIRTVSDFCLQPRGGFAIGEQGAVIQLSTVEEDWWGAEGVLEDS